MLVLTASEQLAGIVAHAIESLGSSGPRLSNVRTLADCLVALRLLSPCMVIVDDTGLGLVAAEALNEMHAARPGTPIVYLASDHTLDLEREIRQRGVLFYVQMPDTPHQLDTVLGQLLARLVRETPGRGHHGFVERQ